MTQKKVKSTDRLGALVINAQKSAARKAESVSVPEEDVAPVTAKSAAFALTTAAETLSKAAASAEVKDPADGATGTPAEVGTEMAPPKENPEPTDPIQPVEQTGDLVDDSDVEQAAKEAAASHQLYTDTIDGLSKVDGEAVTTFIQSKEASAVTDEELAGLEDPEQAAVADYAEGAMSGAEDDAVRDADAVAQFLASQGEGEEVAPEAVPAEPGGELPPELAPEAGMPPEAGMAPEGELPPEAGMAPEGDPSSDELVAAMEAAGVTPDALFADDEAAKEASATWGKMNPQAKSAAVASMVLRAVAPGMVSGLVKAAADAKPPCDGDGKETKVEEDGDATDVLTGDE